MWRDIFKSGKKEDEIFDLQTGFSGNWVSLQSARAPMRNTDCRLQTHVRSQTLSLQSVVFPLVPSANSAAAFTWNQPLIGQRRFRIVQRNHQTKATANEVNRWQQNDALIIGWPGFRWRLGHQGQGTFYAEIMFWKRISTSCQVVWRTDDWPHIDHTYFLPSYAIGWEIRELPGQNFAYFCNTDASFILLIFKIN